jgi:hypothetical protein
MRNVREVRLFIRVPEDTEATVTKHANTNIGLHGKDRDLEGNPGIGTSKGTRATGEDPRLVEGESTVEGDVMNDTTPEGGVDPDQRGRTNK